MTVGYYDERGDATMPRDLQLDLLVDAELPERDRRALLAALDRDPSGAAWRELAMRFLQRQVEKEAVTQLMGGGRLVPAEVVEPAAARKGAAYRFPRWMTSAGLMSTAAGVVIAASSALITLYVVRLPGRGVGGGGATVYTGTLPGQVVGFDQSVAVSVPVTTDGRNPRSVLFPAALSEDGRVTRRSLVIQPDGAGNAVVIPVNTMTMKVY